MTRRTISILVAASVAALSISSIAAANASAAMNVRIVNTGGIGVASRSAPQLAAKNGFGAPEGAVVTLNCHVWGEAVGPRSNRLWDFVSYSGRQFYVSDLYTSSPTVANVPVPGIPFCGSQPPPPQQPAPQQNNGDARASNAANWAANHVGMKYATAADHALLARYGRNGGWAPGPYGEWSGDCMRFAAAAWLSVGVVPRSGATAKSVGDSYSRAGRLKQGVPPVGAIVFYSWGQYGHAGVSLGGGTVVSTQGTDGRKMAVRRHGYRSIGLAYRGWVDPR